MFSVLVGNLFGVKYGGDKDIAEALPFVENMDNLSNYMNVQVEMKLLDLKQKINSPSFTDKEKISLQKTYNYLYKEYGKNISSEVKDILRNYNSEEL